MQNKLYITTLLNIVFINYEEFNMESKLNFFSYTVIMIPLYLLYPPDSRIAPKTKEKMECEYLRIYLITHRPTIIPQIRECIKKRVEE